MIQLHNLKLLNYIDLLLNNLISVSVIFITIILQTNIEAKGTIQLLFFTHLIYNQHKPRRDLKSLPIRPKS